LIIKFKHKGLKQLFEVGRQVGVNPKYVKRLKQILALLETTETIEDMDLPGIGLHKLRGERKGTWAVKVSGNWRLTFKFHDGDIIDLNYEDYH
jgi:proteic killer suppression protein